MRMPFELFIGMRYVNVRGQHQFISFISMISMLGVALGVMALIVVLSVMNGFEKELKERILGMAAHATLHSSTGEVADWQSLIGQISAFPRIEGASPYYEAEGMLNANGQVQGGLVRGIFPDYEAAISKVDENLVEGEFAALQSGEFRIVIGKEMALRLGLHLGDKVALIAAQVNVTPAGVLPRMKRFTVAGIFEVGMHEYDSALAFVHFDDICRLFRCAAPEAIRIQTDDLIAAPRIVRQLRDAIPGHYSVSDWTQHHVNFFKALKTERTVMFVILSLIVAVAAFNIISTLVMMVADKKADIAVMRTMGASPVAVLLIFVIQGTLIGAVGVTLGAFSGVALALNVESLVPALESFFNVEFLPADVYYISDLPSDLHWRDVALISAASFLLCIVSTILPSLRAARIQPAEALRHE